MSLVTKTAPDFTKAAVMPDGSINENFNLHTYIKGKNAVVFFYPLDFTFVCPSEIIAHAKRAGEFAKRNTVVIGVSIDSQFTHHAWRNTPVEKGGLGAIEIPLVADIGGDVMQAYGVEHPGKVALRGSFLIDKNGVVRHEVINDLPLGRDVDEMLRMVDALLFHEEHGEVCPAGWRPGKAGMKADAAGVAAYLKDHAAEL